MRPRRRTSFWRYSLMLEVSTLILTSAILAVAVWITLAEMNKTYLDLRMADAAKVEVLLEGHLDEARASLEQFAGLPEQELSLTVLSCFSFFSDIYQLDEVWRVERIHKAVPYSKVFRGFSFSGGKLGGYLKSRGENSHPSEIMRGHEDDAPSVYFAIRSGGHLYLGCLNLDFVKNFLTQFTQFSGTPLIPCDYPYLRMPCRPGPGHRQAELVKCRPITTDGASVDERGTGWQAVRSPVECGGSGEHPRRGARGRAAAACGDRAAGLHGAELGGCAGTSEADELSGRAVAPAPCGADRAAGAA